MMIISSVVPNLNQYQSTTPTPRFHWCLRVFPCPSPPTSERAVRPGTVFSNVPFWGVSDGTIRFPAFPSRVSWVFHFHGKLVVQGWWSGDPRKWKGLGFESQTTGPQTTHLPLVEVLNPWKKTWKSSVGIQTMMRFWKLVLRSVGSHNFIGHIQTQQALSWIEK